MYLIRLVVVVALLAIASHASPISTTTTLDINNDVGAPVPLPNVPVDFTAVISATVHFEGQQDIGNGTLYWDFTRRQSLAMDGGISGPPPSQSSGVDIGAGPNPNKKTWYLQKCKPPGTSLQYTNGTGGKFGCTMTCSNGTTCDGEVAPNQPTPIMTTFEKASILFQRFISAFSPSANPISLTAPLTPAVGCGCKSFNPLKYLTHLHYNGTCAVGGKTGNLWTNTTIVREQGQGFQVNISGCLAETSLGYAVPLQLSGTASLLKSHRVLGAVIVNVESFDTNEPANSIFDVPSYCSCRRESPDVTRISKRHL
eukprot:TRINITY_DN15659_c0_g1_i1.p1 TRINITY_DN15659_c0_g1~~TRINITY_DN15659_c0_g1_i1.p1  ORF type:complete len:337 (+),score=93.49 TRINITY_DN15659_c0_g1_i1:76-1011(+)